MALSQKQPDISYHPDFEKYQLRIQRLKPFRPAHYGLPTGFPAQLTGPLVWEGKDFIDEKEWTFFLDESQLEEIDKALVHFKCRGFFVLRGLQVDQYLIEENIIIYAGVSSYVGSIRGRQDSKIIDGVKQSSMLNHIKDLSQTSVAGNIGAPADTTDKQVFHTDVGDIVSLFALNTAAKGGESKLASSWRVYNELSRTRPDLIKTLAGNWVFDGYENPAQPYTVKPLLHHTPATEKTPERVVIQYARRGFTGFLHLPRSANIPPITEAQAEALDALHFLAERFSVTLDFQKGDVQYVNNLGIFHARDGFVDAPGRERHLLRLWLRDPELAWETPAVLKLRWDELYKDVTEEEQVFPLQPKIRGGAGKVGAA